AGIPPRPRWRPSRPDGRGDHSRAALMQTKPEETGAADRSNSPHPITRSRAKVMLPRRRAQPNSKRVRVRLHHAPEYAEPVRAGVASANLIGCTRVFECERLSVDIR